MIGGFEFVDQHKTYTCTVEERMGAPDDIWWWFSVTGDAQRYAPFRAARADSQASVRERIVAYYENRKFQLSQPTVRGGPWKQQADAKRAAAAKAVQERVAEEAAAAKAKAEKEAPKPAKKAAAKAPAKKLAKRS